MCGAVRAPLAAVALIALLVSGACGDDSESSADTNEETTTGYAQRGAELTDSLESNAEPFDAPGIDEVAAVVGEDDGYQFAYVDVVDDAFFIHVAAIRQPPGTSTAELEERAADLAVAQLAEVEEFSASGT
jgi:hypothetical protein